MLPPSEPTPAGKPHLLKPPAPHTSGAAHVPHWRSAPHPSLAGPHSYPRLAQVVGMQEKIGPPSGAIPGGKPHLLNPPPPQVCGAVHVPHWRSPPHPSAAAPQVYPSAVQLVCTQDETGPPSGPTPGGRPHLLNPPPP